MSRNRNMRTSSASQRRSLLMRAGAVLIALCLVIALALPAFAADSDSYTYTVRIFAGDKGTVDGKDVIIKTGVEPGYRWSGSDFSWQKQAKATDEKYHPIGVRESGKDNNTIEEYNSFEVNRDIDLVVAYAIRGSETKYTIHYVEKGTNEVLHDVEEYSGNVGDKPVVAYLHIEGYTPQYYNLTGTLSEDASKNDWTFYYEKNPDPEGTTTTVTKTTTKTVTKRVSGGSSSSSRSSSSSSSSSSSGSSSAGSGNASGNQAGGTTAGGTEGGAAGSATTPVEIQDIEEVEEDAADAAEAGENGAGTQETGQTGGPQELVDVDAQQTPLAEYEGSSEEKTAENPETEAPIRAKGMSTSSKVMIGAAAAAALAGAGWYFFKRFASADDEDDDED